MRRALPEEHPLVLARRRRSHHLTHSHVLSIRQISQIAISPPYATALTTYSLPSSRSCATSASIFRPIACFVPPISATARWASTGPSQNLTPSPPALSTGLITSGQPVCSLASASASGSVGDQPLPDMQQANLTQPFLHGNLSVRQLFVSGLFPGRPSFLAMRSCVVVPDSDPQTSASGRLLFSFRSMSASLASPSTNAASKASSPG